MSALISRVGAPRVLIVTPVQQGSGEIITALHVAERMAKRGATIGFLATELARRFVVPRFTTFVWPLGDDGPENQQTWKQVLRLFQPDAILFADYPLMFFPSGCAPLAREPEWV